MKSEMEENKNSMHLIVQYYRCATPERQAEIDTCLRNNLLNPYLTAIHLLTEEQFDLLQFPNNEKIVQVIIGERLTFERAFRYANEADPAGEYVWVLSNADIYFDERLQCLLDVRIDNVVFALTRHDVQDDGSIKLVDESFAHGCQDAWFFKSPLPMDRMFAGFSLGIPGCDNRIAYEFIHAGYKVINPAYLLRALHLDLTRKRDIRERDIEYASLMTDENVAKGHVAPPPYQYHIYPVDQFDPDSPEMYQAYIRHLSELGLQIAERERTLLQQSRQIEELGSVLGENYRQITLMVEAHEQQVKDLYQEMEQQRQQFENSFSWKITKPIRAIHALLTGK